MTKSAAYQRVSPAFRIWRNLTERKDFLSGSFKFLDGELKQIADEKLFLELALRGYALSKLREEEMTGEILKIGVRNEVKERFMWIKSLDNYVWVSMKHITHFSIEGKGKIYQSPGLYNVYAYLDRSDPYQNRIHVCQGSMEECEQFIVERQGLETAFQWLGYIVAGGIGAVLTYFLTGSG